MKNHSYEAQRAATHAADVKHVSMKQWYANKLGVDYATVMNDIARLPSYKSKQLYQEWLNEGSS